MMSNGSRFYIDPSGPEYATPETTTAQEATIRTFDGDEILLSVFEHLRRSGEIEGYQVNRRVVDHNRTSRGIHLNTMTSLEAEEPTKEVKMKLAALNVAKGAIFGSGGLLVDERGQTAFHHSPRLSVTSVIADNYANYQNRPLVRYPFKKDGNFARVETVTADALNFAWPIRASLVVTNTLIRMIENDVEGLPRLEDAVGASSTVGKHGNANQISVIRGEDYEDLRPLDVMREICEKALVEHEGVPFLDVESIQVLGEIIDVSDKMTRDPYSVASQVESVARKIAMTKKMEKEDLGLDSEILCRFDYLWDWLGGGIAERLRQRNLAGWHGFDHSYSALETRKRLSIPPQDTRAKIRGHAIKASWGSNDSDWDMIDMSCFDDTAFDSIYVHPLDNGDSLLS